MKKKSESSVIGSLLKFLLAGIQLFFKIILQLLWYLGLWIPALYILFGVALYLIFGFDPFDWELEGQLYVSGFIACSICSIVITIRNIIIKPAKTVWQKKERPVLVENKSDNKEISQEVVCEEKQNIRPSIYYSTLEENTLIHEYEDRFEIYRIENNKARLERVEYKND